MSKPSVPGHDPRRPSIRPWGDPAAEAPVPSLWNASPRMLPPEEPEPNPSLWRRFRPSISVVLLLLVVGSIGFKAYKEWSDPSSFSYWRDRAGPSLQASTSNMMIAGQARAVLSIRGDVGAAAATWFREQLDTAKLTRGDVVLLSSPGGRVDQAAIIGEIIRARGLNTAVGKSANGKLEPSFCASACSLIYAGGVQRYWVNGSRIGVHQFSSERASKVAPKDIVADTQRTTGLILSYVAKMGVSPLIMEKMSASREMYWLNRKESFELKLATVDLSTR